MTTHVGQRPAAEDDLAAARLYETYGRQLYRFCLARLRSREEAEDAVQNTFLRVYTSLRKGAVPRYEAAWLYKIAHNVCLSRRETLGRRTLHEELDDFDDPARMPVAPEERRDELQALAAAVEALPENLRRAILLREWQGLSYVEIAEELGTTVAAVETLIFRARKALAAELEARGTTRRALDLASLLATLRSLLARLFEAVPAKLAAGAAVVAVGGAGVGAGLTIAEADSTPARPSTTAAASVVGTAAGRVAATASSRQTSVAPARRTAVLTPRSAIRPAATPVVTSKTAAPTASTSGVPTAGPAPAPGASLTTPISTTPVVPAVLPLPVSSTASELPGLETPPLPIATTADPTSVVPAGVAPVEALPLPQLPVAVPAVPTLP